jgi:hypothetical protein
MRTIAVIAAFVAALILAAPAGAAVKRFHAEMSGAQEAPAQGDSDGTGTAALRFDRARSRVCFTIRVSNIGDVVAAHIHRGGRGVMGDIAVDLITEPASGQRFTGCNEDVPSRLIRRMSRRPGRFYVNVHTADYPGGAVRGQIRRGRLPS